MTQLFSTLNFIISIYMVIIFFRIMLTWFSGMGRGGFEDFLARITDPYLNWFRRFSFLRVGFMDLSPIAALGVLSLISRVISMIARYGRISVGIILALTLQVVWGAVSFILGFMIIILILRLVAYLLAQDSGSPFWRIIETISQPVLFRINRILFRDRIVNFLSGLIISIASLGIIYLVLRILVSIVSIVLSRLPF